MERMTIGGLIRRLHQSEPSRLAPRPLLLGLLLLLMGAGWPLLVTEMKPVCGVAFSPDGKQLATLRGIPYDVLDPPTRFELAVWDVASREERLLIPLDKPGWGMAFSPDGKTLAYGTQAGDIELYDADSGRRVKAWAAGAAHATNWLAFAGNSRLLVANGGLDGPKLWDAETGKLLAAAPEAAGGSHFSIQGAQLAVGRLNRSSGTKKTWIYDLSRQRFEIVTTLPEAGSFALSSDARLLAVDGNRDVRIIDLATGQLDGTLQDSWPTELAFSPVANLLAVRKYRSAPSEQIVELLDPTSGKLLETLLKSGISPVHARLGMGLISFTRDGALLAVGNEVGEVRIWDVSSRRLLAELPNAALIRWKTITFVALLIAWCTAWVVTSRQAKWKCPAWVDAAGINLLLAALICLRLFGAGQLFCDPRRPVMWLALAILASWLVLAAFWATFGHTRWPRRLAGLVFALSVSWAVLFLLLPPPHLRNAVSLLSVGTTCLLGWWLMMFAFGRFAGFRLASAAVLPRPASPAKQIDLKDLLLWTAAVAGLFAVARQLQTDLFSLRAIATIVAYTGLLALAAMNAAYLALSESRFKMQCISLIAVSLICGYAASLLSTAEFERVRNWQLGFFVVLASAVWSSLAVFRAHGYRFERNAERLHALLGTLKFAFGTVRSVLATRIW